MRTLALVGVAFAAGWAAATYAGMLALIEVPFFNHRGRRGW